jgi:aldehyde dehydrogenase (NAD+)
MSTQTLKRETDALLAQLGVDPSAPSGELTVISPIDGATIASVRRHNRDDLDRMAAAAEAAFLAWRSVPAPRRGELVRLYGEELRRHKVALGRLVSIEVGKILEEGQGEVQEMIDICDFAVGLSRQLYGRVIASERPGHRMLETWHPLGPVGISRLRCGRGTPRWRSSAATASSGSHRTRRRSARWPATRCSGGQWSNSARLRKA